MSQAATNPSLTSTTGVPVGAAANARPVLTLTPEQAQAKLIELRSADGNLLGLLLRDGGMAKFYLPEELAELNRLAQSRERGRTLREVLDSVQQQAEAKQRADA